MKKDGTAQEKLAALLERQRRHSVRPPSASTLHSSGAGGGGAGGAGGSPNLGRNRLMSEDSYTLTDESIQEELDSTNGRASPHSPLSPLSPVAKKGSSNGKVGTEKEKLTLKTGAKKS